MIADENPQVCLIGLTFVNCVTDWKTNYIILKEKVKMIKLG